MIPWQSQCEVAIEAYPILNKYGIVYLAGEERTGKLLASVLIAEMCSSVENVLVLTTKKALDGWHEMDREYDCIKNLTITNYHQAGKLKPGYDLVILDECHNYLSSYPKPSKTIWVQVKKLTKGIPIIYETATAYPQGPQQLYHQFALSSFSPWKYFKSYYHWWEKYGVPNEVYVYQRAVEQYDTVDHDLVLADVNKYFVKRTRKELNFEQEPEDKLHFIELDEATKNTYNEILKEQYYEFLDGDKIIADTPGSLRANLHQIEGGGCKIIIYRNNKKVSVPKVLNNREKVDYILKYFGDNSNVAIMYNYHSEGAKLAVIFKNAELLQATSNAEGVDLQHIEHLIIYSQDFRTSKHVQRRCRQANKARKTPIIIHFLLVKDAISEQVYETVSINKTNFVDKFFNRSTI